MMEMRRTECNSELVRCEYKFTSSAITSDNEYKFRVEKRGNGNGLLQGSGQGSLWGPLGFPNFWINLNTCVCNKYAISWSWQRTGISAPRVPHLRGSSYLGASKAYCQGWGALKDAVLGQKTFKGQKPRLGRCWEEYEREAFPWWRVIDLPCNNFCLSALSPLCI